MLVDALDSNIGGLLGYALQTAGDVMLKFTVWCVLETNYVAEHFLVKGFQVMFNTKIFVVELFFLKDACQAKKLLILCII